MSEIGPMWVGRVNGEILFLDYCIALNKKEMNGASWVTCRYSAQLYHNMQITLKRIRLWETNKWHWRQL